MQISLILDIKPVLIGQLLQLPANLGVVVNHLDLLGRWRCDHLGRSHRKLIDFGNPRTALDLLVFDADHITDDTADVAATLHKLPVPTSDDQEHAIRAFEANAVNYLMKPVDEDKLADTIERVRNRLAEKKSTEEAEKLMNVLSEVAPGAAEEFSQGEDDAASRYEKLINIKDRGQIFRVEVGTIEHIEAAGDYMCIYTGDNSLILRETMKDLERRLDPRKFQRVHRSTIVNLDQVRQVKPHTNGECFLVLDSGAEVKVSRSYRDVVARFVH